MGVLCGIRLMEVKLTEIFRWNQSENLITLTIIKGPQLKFLDAESTYSGISKYVDLWLNYARKADMSLHKIWKDPQMSVWAKFRIGLWCEASFSWYPPNKK